MEKLPFSAHSRAFVLETCEKNPPDVVILGGGITGAGCLLEATRLGLSALLLEKEDFGSGTSSASSKLIHGGLRYLETGDIALVYQSLKERRILLQNAPQYVRPLPFLYPVYKTHARGLVKVAAGVFLYHALTFFRSGLPRPKFLTSRQTLKAFPHLSSEGILGSLIYHDAWAHDATLTLANVQTAWQEGGRACNHADPTELLWSGGKIAGVRVVNLLNRRTYDIRARWVINATGPWSDLTRRNLLKSGREKLRPTKGTHLILKRGVLPLTHAVLMISPSDQRVTFAIPWFEHALVGTTDVDFKGNPREASADAAEITYLLETVRNYFPSLDIRETDVLSTFTGVRPLVADDELHPSNVSREHCVFSDDEGFVSIIGGKLTSYRLMAKDVIQWIRDRTPEWKDKVQEPRARTPKLFFDETLRPDDFHRMITEQMAATPDDILKRRTDLHALAPEKASAIRGELEALFKSR